MPDTSGSIDLSSLSAEEAEAVENLAQEKGGEPGPEQPDRQKVLTAFLVVVGLDGNPEVMAFNDGQFDILTQVTPDHIYGACSVIQKDLDAREAALVTADIMQQQAMAMQQQMQDRMLAAQVSKNPRGVRA